MKFKTSNSTRYQVKLFGCLDDEIEQDAAVRKVDQIVNGLDIEQYGFKKCRPSTKGAPSYNPNEFVKLFLFGYMEGISSGRKLHDACKYNLKVKWLINGICPAYRTIQYFFSNNHEAFANLFDGFSRQLYASGFIEGKIFTSDSSKIHASNSKTNSKTIRGLKAQITRLEKSIGQYHQELIDSLKEVDSDLTVGEQAIDEISNLISNLDISEVKKKELEKIEQSIQLKKDKVKACQNLKAEMEESGIKHISLTDEDCNYVRFGHGNFGPGYNIQMVSDEKYKLIATVGESGANDVLALAEMTYALDQNLGLAETYQILADCGYYSAKQISKASPLALTFVLEKKQAQRKEFFNKNDFTFNPKLNAYLCPNGKYLTTNGKIQEEKKNGKVSARYHRYSNAKQCIKCPLKGQCYNEKTPKNGKAIKRNIYQDAADANNKRCQANPDIYKQRKCLMEHQFGTIKHHWHFSHTNYRSRKKVLSQYHLIALAYNIRRLISIWEQNGEIELKKWRNGDFFFQSAPTSLVMPLESSNKKVAA